LTAGFLRTQKKGRKLDRWLARKKKRVDMHPNVGEKKLRYLGLEIGKKKMGEVERKKRRHSQRTLRKERSRKMEIVHNERTVNGAKGLLAQTTGEMRKKRGK